MKLLRVAVIGAGGAGLCSAYHLKNNKIPFQIFEKTNSVGGTWRYDENIGAEVHSSMYRDLRTNLPIEAMAFPGHPIIENQPFVHHSKIYKYLEDFATKNKIYEEVLFRHQVTNVEKINKGWKVKTKNLEENFEKEYLFSHLMICSGKYSDPKYVELNGQEHFKGEIMHSHYYRCREPFAGKRVLIVGAGPSGVDIAVELSHCASDVILTHRGNKVLPLPGAIRQKQFVKINKDGLALFVDGSLAPLDVIILCTGYKISFDFLKSDIIKVDEYLVNDLYKHCVYIDDPTLCFIGLPTKVLPLPIFDYQVRFYIQLLNGGYILPDKELMREDTAKDLQSRLDLGWPKHYAHHFTGEYQWRYFDWFADNVPGIERLPESVRVAYKATHRERAKDLVGYRDSGFEFVL